MRYTLLACACMYLYLCRVHARHVPYNATRLSAETLVGRETTRDRGETERKTESTLGIAAWILAREIPD